MSEPQGILSTRAASLMQDDDGLWCVTLFKGDYVIRYDLFASQDQAQRLVDAWTLHEENPEIP